MQQAIQGAKGVTWALYQCHYGASTPKPTRLATNLPGPLTEASEWPVFDDDGWYAGPLSSCGHYHNQPLQGLEGDQWRTGPSAAYPSAFCYYLAQLCLGAIITAPQLADTGAVGQVEHEEQAPHHCYAAFSILHNVKAEAHKDLGNAPTMNLLIGVSQFVNGGLWVEASDGTHKLTIKDQDVFGTVHAVCNSTVLFDARNSWHATMPWTGDRLVIAAYNPAFAENLPAQQHQQLRDLGFPLDLDPQDANVPSSSTLPSGLGDAGVDSEVLGAAGDDGDSAVHEEVQVLGSSEEDASEGKGEKFDPSFSRALGPPMQCHHEGYTKEFVDGFGLCSPGRWPPEARGHLQTLEERKHVASVMKILEDLVQDAIPDVKRKSMELALGRLESSPFTEEQLWRARERICDLLPAPETAREVPERQPFLLHMLGQSLKLLNDPDWEILCQGPESFAEGVPLGCNGELKRTPQVFRERVKSRKLDETDFQPIMQNYSSAELTQNQLEEKFKQDEALGRMIATTEAAARQEYPEVLV
ncbi:glyQS, partial [Symbiodinium microadriaticum]